MTTDECRRVIAGLASWARPLLILTGGEPLLRADIYDLAAAARQAGMPVVLATCGLLVDDEAARRMKAAGVRRISVSLDGATAASHDEFRGAAGAFDGALRGIEAAKRAGLDFQINTTVTRANVADLPAILDLAVRLGAACFNAFLLVPTGRGRDLADAELAPGEYEQALHWLADQDERADIQVRVTCAPHYQRILRERRRGRAPASPSTRKGRPPQGPHGCLGGKTFAFISHMGKVQICGFLDLECGDLRRAGYDFRQVWEGSDLLRQVRDVDGYRGRCGVCEYRVRCGGCRARAFAATGDFLGEEPFCIYVPRPLRGGRKKRDAPYFHYSQRPHKTSKPRLSHSKENEKIGSVPIFEENEKIGSVPIFEAGKIGNVPIFDEFDRRVLAVIQTDLPVTERPFDDLAARLGAAPEAVLERVFTLAARGLIRRLGPVFDSRGLGYVSTLAAARVAPDRLEDVAAAVSALVGVTHNYERRGAYNLWFTLTAASQANLDRTLGDLSRRTGVAFHALPAKAVYKIRAAFDTEERGDVKAPSPPPTARSPQATELDEAQKQLVRALQEGLPAEREPFGPVAARLGRPVEEVLKQVRAWLKKGVIRRFGAVVRQQDLGYRANGMAVFALGPERMDEAGRHLASRPEVTHCYRRPALPGFPYELYAMVHGRTEAEVGNLASRLAAEIGAAGHAVLFSVREFKKTSMRYFV